jgi:branched-chain amino acid aminotransferase
MAYFNKEHGCYHLYYINAHLERLMNGSCKMGLELSWSVEDLKQGIIELLEKEPQNTYYIRPIVYRSVPQINITGSDSMPVDIAIFGVRVPQRIDTSIACHISPIERISGSAIPIEWKICGTYVNSYLARRTAEKSGFNDGIMLDKKGRITEASASNIFFLTKESIVTPALTSEIFPGITRYSLLNLARELRVEVIERDIFPREINSFEGAFLASTLMELKPINVIDTVQYESYKHPIFIALLKKFRESIEQ